MHEQLALFGGAGGMRDLGCSNRRSAVHSTSGTTAKPISPELAAAYGFGLRAKTTRSLTATNGRRSSRIYHVSSASTASISSPPRRMRQRMILALAAGEVSEESLARWIRDNWPKDCNGEPQITQTDREKNRFSARAARYARVGANVGGVAARFAGARFFGTRSTAASNALELAAALGGLKGPIMKVAQLMATIPDALPPEYAAELQKLQSEAPPMGWAFVKRRMIAELGPAGRRNSQASSIIPPRPPRSAKCTARTRASMARSLPASCNIPTCSRRSKPTCSSSWLFAIHRRMDPAIDTTEIAKEIGARMREELDYRREAKHAALYRICSTASISSACRAPGRSSRPAAAHARLARRHAHACPSR